MKIFVRRPTRVYRSRSQLILGIFLSIASIGISIGSIIEKRDHPSSVAAWGAFGIFFGCMAGRMAWARVATSPQGIKVANVFMSFELGWSEIQRFEIGRSKLLLRVCLIRLRNGETKHAFGIEESTNFPNGSAARMVDKLNEELADRSPGEHLAPDRALRGAQAEHFGS